MEITNIKQTKRGMNAVYINGEYRAAVDSETLFKSKWKVGCDISEEEFDKVVAKSHEYKAKEKALRLISYRSHSKKELKDKIKRTTSEESAKKVVSKLEELGLLDDENYCMIYAKDMIFRKKYSVNRVRFELLKKGIDKETIEATIEKINPQERDQICSLLRGKYSGKFSDEKGRKRVISSLQRLGYKWEDIKSVMSDECEGSSVEDGF